MGLNMTQDIVHSLSVIEDFSYCKLARIVNFVHRWFNVIEYLFWNVHSRPISFHVKTAIKCTSVPFTLYDVTIKKNHHMLLHNCITWKCHSLFYYYILTSSSDCIIYFLYAGLQFLLYLACTKLIFILCFDIEITPSVKVLCILKCTPLHTSVNEILRLSLKCNFTTNLYIWPWKSLTNFEIYLHKTNTGEYDSGYLVNTLFVLIVRRYQF